RGGEEKAVEAQVHFRSECEGVKKPFVFSYRIARNAGLRYASSFKLNFKQFSAAKKIFVVIGYVASYTVVAPASGAFRFYTHILHGDRGELHKGIQQVSSVLLRHKILCLYFLKLDVVEPENIQIVNACI